jgi:hypothetical protein
MKSKRGPLSGDCIGALIGILWAILVPPPMMLTELGVVVYILGGAAIGAGAGMAISAIARRMK